MKCDDVPCLERASPVLLALSKDFDCRDEAFTALIHIEAMAWMAEEVVTVTEGKLSFGAKFILKSLFAFPALL